MFLVVVIQQGVSMGRRSAIEADARKSRNVVANVGKPRDWKVEIESAFEPGLDFAFGPLWRTIFCKTFSHALVQIESTATLRYQFYDS